MDRQFASAEARRTADGPLDPKMRQKNTISRSGRNGPPCWMIDNACFVVLALYVGYDALHSIV
jgi:hypothetical protein